MKYSSKILVLSKYSIKGASSRYRFYNYQKYFEKKGFEVHYKPLFGDEYLESLYKNKKLSKIFWTFLFILKRLFVCFFQLKKYQHIIIESEIFPHFPLKIDQYFLKNVKSFSLDFDDNISANYQDTSLQNKIPSLINMANFVTVGNQWYFSEFKGNLKYLPTVIDLESYPIYKKNDENPIPIIVWIGSPSTIKYLKIIENVLIDLSIKYQFKLKIIGGYLDLDPKINTQFVEWNSKTENTELANSDIGIMPLENTNWEKGKCGFKLIQYMASGLPVVASDLPANKEIILNDEFGYIAKSDEDWFVYLECLLINTDLRKKLGENSRNRVEQNYSYQVWGDKFVDLVFKNCNIIENEK